jgi:hypothetical protein
MIRAALARALRVIADQLAPRGAFILFHTDSATLTDQYEIAGNAKQAAAFESEMSQRPGVHCWGVARITAASESHRLDSRLV